MARTVGLINQARFQLLEPIPDQYIHVLVCRGTASTLRRPLSCIASEAANSACWEGGIDTLGFMGDKGRHEQAWGADKWKI